ncbi:hypothetical protein BaRGS_00024477 [Batillaria attramentaria]|uniref:SEA domain-containing protein n=1 Tax=Batillaria attramentaria TaxID=370345 RepID=A0ABD0KAW2_9CAEN
MLTFHRQAYYLGQEQEAYEYTFSRAIYRSFNELFPGKPEEEVTSFTLDQSTPSGKSKDGRNTVRTKLKGSPDPEVGKGNGKGVFKSRKSGSYCLNPENPDERAGIFKSRHARSYSPNPTSSLNPENTDTRAGIFKPRQTGSYSPNPTNPETNGVFKTRQTGSPDADPTSADGNCIFKTKWSGSFDPNPDVFDGIGLFKTRRRESENPDIDQLDHDGALKTRWTGRYSFIGEKGFGQRVVWLLLLLAFLLALAISVAALTLSLEKPETTAEVTGDPVSYVVNGTVRVISESYTEEMKDETSTAFKGIQTMFCSNMTELFSTAQAGQTYLGCKVISLSPGSVVVGFNLFVDSTTPLRKAAITQAILGGGADADEGYTLEPGVVIDKYSLDIDILTTDDDMEQGETTPTPARE